MQIRTVLAATAVAAALGTAGLAAPAMAADNANVTPLYNVNPAFCHGAPANQQLKASQEGFVNFHQDGQTVTLNYHIKGAVPDTTYTVDGYDSFCHFDAVLGTLTTNGNGVANADFTYTIPAGATEVWTFAFAFTGTGFTEQETPAVTP